MAAGLSSFAGRWVLNGSKHDNWEGLWKAAGGEAPAAEEAREPMVAVVTAAAAERVSVVYQLPRRAGLQCECVLELDGAPRAIPAPLLEFAASSWLVRGATTWAHRLSGGCLVTEQDVEVAGTAHVLRTTRSLLSGDELQASLQLLRKEGGALAEVASASRYFTRVEFRKKWRAASAQFFSGKDVAENLRTCVAWMEKAKKGGADLIVMPENSNRDRSDFSTSFSAEGKLKMRPCRERAYDLSEDLDGPFVRGIQQAARELGMWVVVGVDLRGETRPEVFVTQVLIRPDGAVHGVHTKMLLWDYEYTLFSPGRGPFQVFDTELGRLGLLICGDGIIPECPRVMCCMGAQVLINSLNSRGPDELRTHIPLRSYENKVWHISSNCVGNPGSTGLLWPWTGGSQVVAPDGSRVVAASEEHDDIIFADIEPWQAEDKRTAVYDDVFAARRPELYGILTRPIDACPVAPMLGPAPAQLPAPGPEVVKAAMMQLSRIHTRECTEWMTKRQVSYGARRGAHVGVLPELWCFKRGEVGADPAAAAAYSATVLAMMVAEAQEHAIHIAFSLVERDGAALYHTAYLAGPKGLAGKYRKAHLNKDEKWATPGDRLSPVFETELGRVALMIGDEVWVPEVAWCLALEGVELVLHPTDWDCADAGDIGATERASENRFHLVSTTRIDCPGKLGSQISLAGEYIGGEPIPLMRYAQGAWTRHNVEEQVIVDLRRREAHCKVLGDCLDILKMRFPGCCAPLTRPTKDLFIWRTACGGLPDLDAADKAGAAPAAAEPSARGAELLPHAAVPAELRAPGKRAKVAAP